MEAAAARLPSVSVLWLFVWFAPADSHADAAVQFVDVGRAVGVTALNRSGSTAKRIILETTGSGACFLDYDGDSLLDVYLVNGQAADGAAVSNTLYRNRGDGSFADVTAAAGVGDRGWGGGCTVGDIDNDGDPDLYVTNFGPNVLYLNTGNGSFENVTRTAGVGDARWGSGAVFADFDGDGWLDLYVANYLHYDTARVSIETARCYWKGAAVMCGPRGFPAAPDLLYRNRGDGRFDDVSAEAGIAGLAAFGLGVVSGDIDKDGDTDIVVANDSQPNFLLINDGHGYFTEGGLTAGLAVSGDGRPQAGMGIDLGDYDNDGDEDLIVTNFSNDYHSLYRNDGELFFSDVSRPAGLERSTRPSLGWAAVFLDYDNDGDLDLFIAGGHVYPEVDAVDPSTSYRQRNLLLRNDGRGHFDDVGAAAGPGLSLIQGSRGTAVGDYDNDGDLDLLVVNDNEAPALLRNDGGNRGNWIKVRLIGERSNRDGIGSAIEVKTAGGVQRREFRLSAGYYSSHDPRLHLGLGSANQVDSLTVRWPSGISQQFKNLPVNRLVTIHESSGLLAQTELQPVGAVDSPRLSAPDRTKPPGRDDTLPAPVSTVSDEAIQEIDAYLQNGTRLIVAGRYDEGIAAYRRVIARLPPWDPKVARFAVPGFDEPERYRAFLASIHDNLGVGLMRSEQLDACAESIGEAIRILPSRAKFQHNLGLCHFHARRYDEAIEALRAALELGRDEPGVHYDLGRSLALSGSCDSAREPLERAVRELPNPDTRGRRAQAWYHLGECWATQSRHTEAAGAFREALALVPGDQKALYRLGQAWRRAGRTAAADAVETLVERRGPADEQMRSMKQSGLNSLEAQIALAGAYLETRQASRALREARALLALRPADADGLALLGLAALSLQPSQLLLAEQAYSRLLQLRPRDPRALTGLAEVRRHQERHADAAALLHQADPFEVSVAVALARLHRASAGRHGDTGPLRKIAAGGITDTDTALALAEIAIDNAPLEALNRLRAIDSIYGEGVRLETETLIRLGRYDEARALIDDSPFLGRRDRVEFGQRLTMGPPG